MLGVGEAYAKALKNDTARGDVQRHLHGNNVMDMTMTLGNRIIRNDQTNLFSGLNCSKDCSACFNNPLVVHR